MIDHTGVSASNFAASKAFYAAALAPLGITLAKEFSAEQTAGKGFAGFGRSGKPEFWIHGGGPTAPMVHVAFRAKSRDEVDVFHKAALAAGGRDNGAPGLRPHYHADYYGAFMLDGDGNNIEAVFHG